MSCEIRSNSAIAITGVGIVCPSGIGIQMLEKTLVNGASHVREIVQFETEDLPCRVGAWIDDFDPRDYIDGRSASRIDRAAQLFVASTILAIDDRENSTNDIDRNRVGIFEGTSLGGLSRALMENELFSTKGYSSIHPTIVNAAMTGSGAGLAAIVHGITGPVTTFSNGSISSHTAIAVGVQALQRGEIDLALAGGGEAPVYRPILAAFGRARVLSKLNHPPGQSCRSFDLKRDGTVLGEAGAVLVLERTNDAISNGSNIYAEILATSHTNDAFSLFAPDPDATQQARSMTLALSRGRVNPSELDYLSAHGTGTRINDCTESSAIRACLGKHAYRIAVSSSKPMLGHSLGACSVVETIKVLTAMLGGFVPPTINLTKADPECDLDYVPLKCRNQQINTALINNSSFGGKNGSILIRKWNW